MFTYSAVFGMKLKDETERALSIAGSSLKKVMPDAEKHAVAKSTFLQHVTGGWTTVLLPKQGAGSLIQEAREDDLSVLVHGRISGRSKTAEHVMAQYRSRGAEGVFSLDGAFFAIIVEHHTKKVVLCSDLIGHMAARYIVHNGALVISSHDVGLVAMTDLNLKIDPVSVLSMGLFDWSIGGHSILSALKVTSPLFWYTWQEGKLTEHSVDPFPERTARLQGDSPRNDLDTSPYIEEVIEHLLAETRNTCDSANQIVISLTGGMDSRLLLALVLGSAAQTPIKAVTGGTPWSMDVVLAGALSKITHTPHTRIGYEGPDLAGFMSEAKRYAFHFNGDTSAKRALRQGCYPIGETRLTGGAGEIYRGYYYGLIDTDSTRKPSRIAQNVWEKNIKRRHGIFDIADRSMTELLRQRLFNIFRGYETFACSPHDLVDAFYLFERYSRWGALVTRRVWIDIRSPLACPSAIRSAYKIPGNIGEHSKLHETCISRFLPRAGYWLPVNLRRVLPLGKHKFEKHLAKAGGMIDSALRRLDNKVGATRDVSLAGPLFETIEGYLSNPDGVTVSVFGKKQTATLLENFRRTPQDLHEPVSCLLSAEIWLQQLRETKASATAISRSAAKK